jgi:RNA polymerase sigma-70 factor (ECF subfamily)
MAAILNKDISAPNTTVMQNYQRVLFPYAYNILGTSYDALDAIQEAVANYYARNREGIEDEKNYLIRSVINQSINLKNKKKASTCAEVWLPEPLSTESADKNTELKEIASYSMLVLLEQLNAKERAVFVLKEAFDYSHEEIADFLSIAVENSRKILSRAKRKLKPGRSDADIRPAVATEQLEHYVSAIRTGNIAALKELFSQDIEFYADGGVSLNVAAKTLVGNDAVSDVLLMVYKKHQSGFSIVPANVNHHPALLYYSGRQLISCQVFEFSSSGKITRMNIVVDPEKLRNLNIYTA